MVHPARLRLAQMSGTDLAQCFLQTLHRLLRTNTFGQWQRSAYINGRLVDLKELIIRRLETLVGPG